MTEDEMISVIIPVYNVEKYLDKCIRSVVEQTYKNLEIILVDDGSSDQCGAICDKWAERDERIRVIHKANGGVSDARNAGLDLASGTYIGFVDSDDYIHPEMYQRLYEKIKKCDADLALCGFDWVDEQDNTIIRSEKTPYEGLVEKKDAIRNILFNTLYVVVWNKLFKRELFLNRRFMYGKYGEDIFIMPELYNSCKRIVILSDKYYCYVQSPNSICRREKTVWHLDAVEAYYEMLLFCKYGGYTDLLQDISDRMVVYYVATKGSIKKILPNEITRLRKIKKMVLYVYIKHGQGIRLKHRLGLVNPAFYCFLARIKKKLS